MRKLWVTVTTIALLGACTSTAQQAPGPAGEPDTCGAAALQVLIGQPESALQGVAIGGPLRIIHPGEMVTMDYSAARLNVALDASGRIERVTCG